MTGEGILIKGDIQSISDSLKTLKYRSPTNWRISIGLDKDAEKKKQEKLKTLRNNAWRDYENARYDSALVNVNEFLSIVGADSHPEVLELKRTIELIKTIQDKIRESGKNRNFPGVHKYLGKLAALNPDDKSALKELEFLEQAIPFLDGSILEKIKDSKQCQDSIAQLSELIKESPAIYKDHLIDIKNKLLDAQKEYIRKKKVEELNHKIKLALEADYYDAVILCIKEAKKYIKNENELIFTESQYNEIVELKEKQINTEIDEIKSQKKKYRRLKVLKYAAAAAAVIIFIYLVIDPIPNYLNKRKIDNYLNEAQVLLAAKEFEQLKKKLNQLSGAANKVKNPGKIDDIKYLFENSFNRLMNRSKNHQEKGRYDEAIKHAEMAKKFAGMAKEISMMAQKIRGFPINLTIQWTEKSAARIKELEKKIKSLRYNELIELAKLDYKNGKYDSAIKKLEEAKKLKPLEEIIVEMLLIDVKYEKYLKTGMSYFRQGDYTKALENFEIAKGYKPTLHIIHMISDTNYEKYLQLGRSYYQKKDYEKAIEQFEKARKYKSTSTVDEEILKTIKEIRLQELYKRLDKYKNSKDTENVLKIIMEIKEVKEEPYKAFDLLPPVAYKNPQGYPGIVLRDITFVFIQGAEFEMGCFNPADESYLKDAQPVHRVRLSSFWISKTEITNAQYKKYVKRHELNYPVNDISWTSAHGFATSFGEPFSLNSNLPTEAQWEYAARNGGDKTVYPWGNEITCQKANYSSCTQRLKPVARYEPNKFGVFDLSGNVREWCRDVYNKYYYSRSPAADPVNTWNGSNRVVRGGNYEDGSIFLRTYMRYSRPENSTDKYTGFRIVIERSIVKED